MNIYLFRTKEQLGYIVYAHIRRASGVQGLQIVVQSGKHPEYVDTRIEAFLASLKVSYCLHVKHRMRLKVKYVMKLLELIILI